MSNFSKVGTFMKTFGQEVKDKPAFSTDKINKLRIDLIKEELEELTEAMKNNDLLEVADALTDILYVTYKISVRASATSNRSLFFIASVSSPSSSLIRSILNLLILSVLKEGLFLTSCPKVFMKIPTLLKFDILLL